MKSTSLASFIVVAISVAAGCSPGPKKAERTVEQYAADQDLRNKKVEECANNPGELRDDPDCINAIAAARKRAHKTLRDLYKDAPAEAAGEPESSTR